MIQLPNKLAILGMGYVGAPLAIEFSKHFEVIGFDISSSRITELNNDFDKTYQIDLENNDFPNSLKCIYHLRDVMPIYRANIP